MAELNWAEKEAYRNRVESLPSMPKVERPSPWPAPPPSHQQWKREKNERPPLSRPPNEPFPDVNHWRDLLRIVDWLCTVWCGFVVLLATVPALIVIILLCPSLIAATIRIRYPEVVK